MRKYLPETFTWRRVLGVLLMALGALVLVAPIFLGEWIAALLGIALIAAGLIHFVETLLTADDTTSYMAHAAGVVSVLLGVMLLFSPKTALSGMVAIVAVLFLLDAGTKLYTAYTLSGSDRWWSLVNGVVTLLLGLLVLLFLFNESVSQAVVIVVLGVRSMVEGWAMFFTPEDRFRVPELVYDTRAHPDHRLGLEPNSAVQEVQEAILNSNPTRSGPNVVWSLTMLGIFFLVHFLRTDARWSYLELISPVTALIGDAVVALLISIMVVLPIRMIWRKLTRPLERLLWYRLIRLKSSEGSATALERFLQFWLEARMRFTIELSHMRYSLNFAFWRVLRFGLPATAVLVAVNSIWGFSWYFNSENWASGVYQEITKGRVDLWRERMTADAARVAIENGVPPESVFAIAPEGVSDSPDFSFVVIGDTGEGDPSQHVLRDRIIEAGSRPEVKFLLLSSDVIYPDGKMKDYERNFYLPFKGFRKPIYAIPGNHDWFDANEGFNANFLYPDSARAAMRARESADIDTSLISADDRFGEIIGEAARLRNYYGIANGRQRAPYFEMHTEGFSLIAVDTGILRRIDPAQREWLERALQRAGENFKLVVLGHPFYVSGNYAADGDAEFAAIHELLKQYRVNAIMAGDTHDLEYYRRRYPTPEGEHEMAHFVNGGGGAYLSIGTAVGFPKTPVTEEYAFYPSTEAVEAKISETSIFRWPFYFWLKTLRGWPFDQEMVSGAFDFNSSPFFQSFIEVRVERTQNRVRFIPHGVHGPLPWSALELGPGLLPANTNPNAPAEFTLPLGNQRGLQ